jgi:hypothetical protein
MSTKLLSINDDHKTIKGVKFGFLTGILYLAPSNESGVINTCPNASKGCREACLYTAGRGIMSPVKAARVKKTVMFAQEREKFMQFLVDDIIRGMRQAKKKGLEFVVRLNGTSDIAWEKIPYGVFKNVMEAFPQIRFYDYTKSPARILTYLTGGMPSNYHLTFSRSESNALMAKNLFEDGANVAIVYVDIPKHERVIDGDISDLRFLDPANSIVALKAKGKAKKDTSGFVVHT